MQTHVSHPFPPASSPGVPQFPVHDYLHIITRGHNKQCVGMCVWCGSLISVSKSIMSENKLCCRTRTQSSLPVSARAKVPAVPLIAIVNHSSAGPNQDGGLSLLLPSTFKNGSFHLGGFFVFPRLEQSL